MKIFSAQRTSFFYGAIFVESIKGFWDLASLKA